MFLVITHFLQHFCCGNSLKKVTKYFLWAEYTFITIWIYSSNYLWCFLFIYYQLWFIYLLSFYCIHHEGKSFIKCQIGHFLHAKTLTEGLEHQQFYTNAFTYSSTAVPQKQIPVYSTLPYHLEFLKTMGAWERGNVRESWLESRGNALWWQFWAS